MMTIRSATSLDIPKIQALAHSIWNKVYPTIISQAQIDYMLELMYSPSQIQAELLTGYDWEVIEFDEQAIGFVSSRTENGTTLKLSKIYIEPAFHGRGFGQVVLKHFDAKAKQLGLTSIYLYVNRNNERAIQSYIRGGYAIVQSLDQIFGNFMLYDYKLAKTVTP